MSGDATRKLSEAADALMQDFESTRETMTRIAQIQAKMSQCMDECQAEFQALFVNPDQRPLESSNYNDMHRPQTQDDLPRSTEPAIGTRYMN